MWKMTNSRLLIVLFCGFLVYYVLPLNFRALWQPDETRYSEISREMLAGGDWLVPHFMGIRYFEKPIAGYWLNTLGQWLVGYNNTGVRAGSVTATLLTAILVIWLARWLFSDNRIAVMAGAIHLTMLIVYGVGTYAVLDPAVTFLLTAAMCTLWRAFEGKTTREKATAWLLTGVICGMGVMTKGFLALAVPVVSVVPWAVLNGRVKEMVMWGGLAVVSAVLTVLPWGLAVHVREPDYWRWFIMVEHVQRFASEDAQHRAPFWYYLPLVVAGALPWAGLLPGALTTGLKYRSATPALFWLLCFFVMPLLLFSLAKGKLLTYILPCFAPLAILMAHYASSIQGGAGLRLNGWINVVAGVSGMAAILIGIAPWGVHPLYTNDELWKVAGAMLAFAVWALAGGCSLTREGCSMMAVLCPLGVVLLVGAVIPAQTEYAKQPQRFIENIRGVLEDSRYILVQNPGVASAVSGAMARSDIILFEDKGELRYGLGYPEAQERYVSADNFPAWLSAHRHRGQIVVICYLPSQGKGIIPKMPPPDEMRQQGRLALLVYVY